MVLVRYLAVKEIQDLAVIYRSSKSNEAKEQYGEYISTMLNFGTEGQRSELEKMWEWEIE